MLLHQTETVELEEENQLSTNFQPLSVQTHHVHHLKSFQQFAVSVFEAVGLVDHHTAPRNTTKFWTVGQNHLKGGDDCVESVDSFDHFTLQPEDSRDGLGQL